jgi:hypothetical protein
VSRSGENRSGENKASRQQDVTHAFSSAEVSQC